MQLYALSRIACLFLIIFFVSLSIQAQNFGGQPPRMKWHQINTNDFRIIFSKGDDSTALRVANIIQNINKPTSETIGDKRRKINIVLQNQTLVSNGYVGMSPFKSEFFLTAPQNAFRLGSIPWPDLLAIHEFRHVQQDNNFNVGLSHLFKILFGDEGQALINSAAIPNWFFEGDAVYNETHLSKQGRGSLPYFYDGFRAMWSEGTNYTWMKLRNGSLKDYVPDHYQLGFLLVGYGYEKYGPAFWKNVTQHAASFKSPIYPFQQSIKKYTGKDYKTFRKEAFDYYKAVFKLNETHEKKISKAQKYINEEYPYFDKNGDLIYLESRRDRTPSFIIKSKEGTRKIRTPDSRIDDYFSYKNGKIIYAGARPDIRWSNRDYTVINIVDVNSASQKVLTQKGKWFSPNISDDFTSIVAVNEDPSQHHHLVLLNTENESLKQSLPNNENLHYSYPMFYKSDIISVVSNEQGKMSLAIINPQSSHTQYILPFSYNVIGKPVAYNDTLYFSYSYLKEDELFAISLNDRKIWKITHSASQSIGKYQPAVNDSFIVWSTFTASGNRLQKISKEALLYTEMIPDDIQKITASFGLTAINAGNSNLLYATPNDSFEIKKYPRAYRFFNFHSIEPFVDDPDYSLSLVGENILSTFQSEIKAAYNRAEGFKTLGLNGTFGGWFPFISAGYKYTFDRQTSYKNMPVFFNQSEMYASFAIPLNLSKGRSFSRFNAGSQITRNQTIFQKPFEKMFTNYSFNYLNHFLTYSHQSQKASQQIYPSFAQAISLSYKLPISKFEGYQAMANTYLYFPGLSPTHSIVINGAVLKKDTLNQINFSSSFPFSRGYDAINFPEMYKAGINYHFPLAFPDVGFANIMYLLRLRLNVFYDHTFIQGFDANKNRYHRNFRSLGSELSFDTKWWNQVPISFGIRYAHLLDNDIFNKGKPNRWEIILPVNLLNNR